MQFDLQMDELRRKLEAEEKAKSMVTAPGPPTVNKQQLEKIAKLEAAMAKKEAEMANQVRENAEQVRHTATLHHVVYFRHLTALF